MKKKETISLFLRWDDKLLLDFKRQTVYSFVQAHLLYSFSYSKLSRENCRNYFSWIPEYLLCGPECLDVNQRLCISLKIYLKQFETFYSLLITIVSVSNLSIRHWKYFPNFRNHTFTICKIAIKTWKTNCNIIYYVNQIVTLVLLV